MKLYATVTSERASKGQGGNKELDILIQAEGLEGIPTRTQVLRLLVRNEDGQLTAWLVNYETGKSTPVIRATKQKANKQKAPCKRQHRYYNESMGVRCERCLEYLDGFEVAD